MAKTINISVEGAGDIPITGRLLDSVTQLTLTEFSAAVNEMKAVSLSNPPTEQELANLVDLLRQVIAYAGVINVIQSDDTT